MTLTAINTRRFWLREAAKRYIIKISLSLRCVKSLKHAKNVPQESQLTKATNPQQIPGLTPPFDVLTVQIFGQDGGCSRSWCEIYSINVIEQGHVRRRESEDGFNFFFFLLWGWFASQVNKPTPTHLHTYTNTMRLSVSHLVTAAVVAIAAAASSSSSFSVSTICIYRESYIAC